MKRRTNSAGQDGFVIYIVPAWKWKEFIAYELIGGIAFYLIAKIAIHAEWFCIAANMAGPQMLKYTATGFRL